MNVLSETCPCEPKYPNAKADASDDDGWKSPFWDGHVVVRREFAVVAWRDCDHEDGTEELTCDVRLGSKSYAIISLTTDHSKERQLELSVSASHDNSRKLTHASHARVESVCPLKHYGIEGQKEVEYAVHESHVYADSQDNRFREQKPQRARHVLLE
jgi:hypothetical protein